MKIIVHYPPPDRQRVATARMPKTSIRYWDTLPEQLCAALSGAILIYQGGESGYKQSTVYVPFAQGEDAQKMLTAEFGPDIPMMQLGVYDVQAEETKRYAGFTLQYKDAEKIVEAITTGASVDGKKFHKGIPNGQVLRKTYEEDLPQEQQEAQPSDAELIAQTFAPPAPDATAAGEYAKWAVRSGGKGSRHNR